MNDLNMKKIGLVLEGGGMRGLYTSGVLDVMLDKGFHADVICGTSAGVTFGVNLPSCQKGRVLRYNSALAGNPEYISVRSLLRTGDMINVNFAYHKLPEELDLFDNEAYNSSGVEFYATVTNVRTGEAEYLPVRDCVRDIDVIRASASLPFISRKVNIGGEDYLDGGIVDNIPIEKALSLGCDKIIVVLTHPRGYVRKDRFLALAKLFYPKDKNLVAAFAKRNERYNDCIAKLRRLEEDGKVFVIAPSHELDIARLEKSVAKMQATHALGYSDAAEAWPAIESYLKTF